MKNPPTAVGGILFFDTVTAVGGFSLFVQSYVSLSTLVTSRPIRLTLLSGILGNSVIFSAFQRRFGTVP